MPLTQAAAIEVQALIAQNVLGPNVFSTDGGLVPMWNTTFAKLAKQAASAIPGFEVKRIRSAVETELSKRGIGFEVRARLQSHDLGGVIARHYNANDFMPEMRHALETLFSALSTTETPKVVRIRAGK